ncbi:MAG: lysophospholipid acyltransferase family protein [Vicinamibacteria bacterium]
MVRAVVAACVVAFATAGLAPLCLLFALGGRRDRAHGVIRFWSRLLTRAFGIAVVVAGTPHEGPAVYAANHASAADVPFLFGFLPFEFRIIYKRSLAYVPLVGWCLLAAGHVAIDRANPFRARRSLEAAAARIRAGTSVVVFPEGTRSPDGSVAHFKRGSFSLAIQAGVPIVPVSLMGVKNVIPRGLGSLRPGTVRVLIHPPLPTAGRRPEDAQALAEETRVVVARGVAQERGAEGVA